MIIDNGRLGSHMEDITTGPATGSYGNNAPCPQTWVWVNGCHVYPFGIDRELRYQPDFNAMERLFARVLNG